MLTKWKGAAALASFFNAVVFGGGRQACLIYSAHTDHKGPWAREESGPCDTPILLEGTSVAGVYGVWAKPSQLPVCCVLVSFNPHLRMCFLLILEGGAERSIDWLSPLWARTGSRTPLPFGVQDVASAY